MAKRDKDNTPIICKLCTCEVVASGMPSHLYHKHNKLSSQQYVDLYGEFRKSYLTKHAKKQSSGVVCKLCNTKCESHKQLLHHLHTHDVSWQQYFVQFFFNGQHPTCSCGCGQEVQLLRNGKGSNGEVQYARQMLPGHHLRKPGYRYNTQQQKDTMRAAAIKRMQNKEGSFFTSGPSKSEVQLQQFLSELGIEFLVSDREVLSGLELDILIPSHKIAIEFNGGYFHSDLFKKKDYHVKKSIQCFDKGYRLVHVWESDWHSKKPIVQSMLANLLGKTKQKLYARNTTIKQIPSKQAYQFLSTNHLQGAAVGNTHLGLFSNNQLVAVMSFSSLRKAVGLTSKQHCYELVRYCTLLNTTVVGGASKLYQYFVNNYKPNYILSYAKRDWSVGNLYSTLGMDFKGYTKPGYFYTKSKHKFSRFQFQKHILVQQGEDCNKTEYQIMLDRGFHRVWDCGNLKFEQHFT